MLSSIHLENLKAFKFYRGCILGAYGANILVTCAVFVAISHVKEWMYFLIMFLLLKSCLVVHSLGKVGIKSVIAVLSTLSSMIWQVQ